MNVQTACTGFDGSVDPADRATHNVIGPGFGWIMPIEPGEMRNIQLRTDVDLTGVHTLSLSGDAFRVWQSANPGTANAPLLVAGQTVTNGVNGVSWGMNHTANVYIQAVTNGTATLTYSFIGTGSASGIVCRASMKLTAVDLGIELWARDPETSDVYECTSLVLASHPVPQIGAEIADAYLDEDGTLNVEVAGSFVDRMSEVCEESDRVDWLHLSYGGEEVETFAVSYTAPETNLWQRASSATDFASWLTVPDAAPGLHLFTLTSDENAAGEVGQAFVYVLIGEEEEEPQVIVPEDSLSIAFPAPPATNALDVAIVSYEGTFGLAESTNTTSDLLWEGATTNDTLVFCATAPLSNFSSNVVDGFTATIHRISSIGVTNDFVATLTETSPTSLVFNAVAYFDPVTPTHPVILEAGTLEGTPPGYIEPFVAKVVSSSLSRTQITNLLAARGMVVSVHGEPLEVVEREGELYLADEGESSPRLFAALADRQGVVPFEAWEDRCIAFTLAMTNSTAVAEFASWITDPAFAEEATAAAMSPSMQTLASMNSAADWTVDDAWTMFEILFGESGRTVKERYLGFGGTVVKQETTGLTWRRYTVENFSGWTDGDPRVVLDDDIGNAVDAALALYDAVSKLNGLFARYDFKQYVVDDILSELADDPEALAKFETFWRDGYAELGDAAANLQIAMEMGVSITSVGTGFLIDLSHVSEDLDGAKYGKAVMGLALACLGPIADAKATFQSLDIFRAGRGLGWTDEVVDGVRGALARTTRPERLDSLRPLIQNGALNAESVELLYNSGFLKGKNPYGTLERFIQSGTGAFPGTGVAHLKGVTIRHHDFPRQFELDFLKAGYDPNSVGRAIAKDAHKAVHTGKGWGHGGPWNYQWEQFFKANSGPYLFDPSNPESSIKALLDKLRQISGEAAVDESKWPFIPDAVKVRIGTEL